MDRQDYIYASARIRVFEKKLLKKEQVMRLVQAADDQEFLRFLQESDYGKDLQVVERQEDFHAALDQHWNRILKEVLEMAKDTGLVELIRLRYVYHNYKVLIKEHILQQDLSRLYLDVPDMDPRELKNDLEIGETGLVPDFLYTVLKDYEENKDVQRIDLLLDRMYFEEMLEQAETLEEPLFKDFVLSRIDFANIKALMRLKAQGVDYQLLDDIYLPGARLDKETFRSLYNEEPQQVVDRLSKQIPGSVMEKAKRSFEANHSLTQLDKLFDDALMDNLRDRSRVTFGPEVLLAYLSAKEKEIANLRMIYTSLVAGISADRIEERLRDSYV
mgnify:CR=1 FL=1